MPTHRPEWKVRGITDAIHNGLLVNGNTDCDRVFGFHVVTELPGVLSQILGPRGNRCDKSAYNAAEAKLAALLNKNFKAYAAVVTEEIKKAAPG
jgi:phosphoenolpyruvate carboxykinase (ATP)